LLRMSYCLAFSATYDVIDHLTAALTPAGPGEGGRIGIPSKAPIRLQLPEAAQRSVGRASVDLLRFCTM